MRVEENSVTLGEYTYNGLGQRIIKTAGGVTTIFLYDFDGNIIAETDQTGSISKEYLYKGSSRLAMVDVLTGKMYYYGNDKLGTPQIMTDTTNTVVWEADYKPFGEAEVNPNSSVVNNFRFQGQYYDAETGMHYNWNRYYDPGTGRYTTADPIGLYGGINLFVYAGGNPINYTDSKGLQGTIPANPIFPPLPIPTNPIKLSPRQWQDMKDFFRPKQPLEILSWLAGIIDGPDDPTNPDSWKKWARNRDRSLINETRCESLEEPPPPPDPCDLLWERMHDYSLPMWKRMAARIMYAVSCKDL